ncbi:MAG: potassium transporter TrkA [Chloroflexi bacterium HGW-Chloroflexi-1]|nr:MAG: potassium transporter TrkA [Chloroflexi bacterium HGW-Chloroflexi-1]
MFVVIAGGGRMGAQLGILLVAQKHTVHLIENRPDVLARIHHELPTEVIYEGTPTMPQALEQAGIQKAQVLAACTAEDADNLVLCFLARERYHVARTIARINNPRNAWLFDAKFHVDVAINQADMMARLIAEEMSLGDMMTLLKLRKGEISVVEEKIPAGARVVGVAIKDLALPEHCVIAAIIRQGEVVVPRGVTTFEVDDEVLAVTNRQGVAQLAHLFAPEAHAE